MRLDLDTVHFWFFNDSGDTELMILDADDLTAEFSNVMGAMVHKDATEVKIYADGDVTIDHYPDADFSVHMSEEEDEDYD